MGSGSTPSDLALFAHVATRAEEELDLTQAALLIAEPEYPGLDVAHYAGLLDKVGDEARRRVTGIAENGARRLSRLLFEEVGFEGSEADYYDPRNSFLNEVIDRRTGIPVTLAVVYIEVARRAGIEARGIGFPGHFLVEVVTAAPAGAEAVARGRGRGRGAAKRGSDDTTLVDPFTGKLLAQEDLRALVGRATGEASDPDPSLLEPVPKRQILVRMLNNLKSIYAQRRDEERLRRTLEQLVVLAPADAALRRELEVVGGRAVVAAPSKPGGKVVN